MSLRMTFKYEFLDEDFCAKRVECETHEVAWPEILDDFIYFMQGCGFNISPQALSDYFRRDDKDEKA